jgi:hypothetical protein
LAKGKAEFLGSFTPAATAMAYPALSRALRKLIAMSAMLSLMARRDLLGHPDFFEKMSRFVRVSLSNSFVGLSVIEDLDFPLEFDEVFLSPSNFIL